MRPGVRIQRSLRLQSLTLDYHRLAERRIGFALGL
jgi:hypothetical protein